AFFLGLSGPAHSINTACSTGLVSVVEACQKLQLGTCNMALAGGVSLRMPDQVGYIYQEEMITSRDGYCRTFDKEASGTTGGSGVGVVLLKRLEDAIKDQDTILGVIKGYTTNNDGDRKTSYVAPSIVGQSECIINAQKIAGIKSNQIDYVECHGTGTNLGDPIEVQALREAFEYNKSDERRSKHKTILGAIKANIGHTDSAAGIAGLIKICTMLQNNVIPGQANFNKPNPELFLDQTNFEILKENKAWLPSSNKQRLAGVSSFGIGGTNAHVIIGDYIVGALSQSESEQRNISSIEKQDKILRYIIPISAKSSQSLEYYRQSLIEYLTGAIENESLLRIQDIAYTLQERREHFAYRSAYCVISVNDLISKLKLDTLYTHSSIENKNKVIFMFPGQGVQYIHMAKALYTNERIFRDIIDQCIVLANRYLDIDLHKVMYPNEVVLQYDINETRWAQISLFILEYGLAKYLEYLGVKVTAYIGHSIGEYVAATLSGVFVLEDAIKVVIARGELMNSMQLGSMLAVNAEEETIDTIVEDYGCEIAVVNSLDDIVVSGNNKEINKLQKVLNKQAIPTVKLNTSHAYHSKMMDKASVEFKNVFKNVKLNRPRKDFISNLTGKIAKEEVTTVNYWCKQLRHVVQFADGIDYLSKRYNYKINFIEVGVGKGLSYFVNKYKNRNNHKSLRTLQLLPSAKEVKSNKGLSYQDIEYKEDIKANLWMNGIIQKANNIKLLEQARLQTSLPTYQFNYQRYWLEKNDNEGIKKYNSINDIFYKRSWERGDLNLSFLGVDSKSTKHKNVLLLINDKNIKQSGTGELLNLLNSHFNNLSYVIHQQGNSIRSELLFDFENKLHISTILDEKTKFNPIDLIIYISPSIDVDNPTLDIFAVRNLFDWSKDSGNKIPKFISISLDNYEVLGNEQLQGKSSIIYGVTKSIPFEYFTSGTETLHVDLSLRDSNYRHNLLSVLGIENIEKDLVAIRGKYQWFLTYQQVKLSNDLTETIDYRRNRAVILITGGLGGIGYAYANHIVQNANKKYILIIIGRTVESNLRDNNKSRLTTLRNTKHDIVYLSLDIGHSDSQKKLEKLFLDKKINNIDIVLHSAGIAAKSAIYEKTHDDIEKVVNPKILGVENLIKLTDFVTISNLVSCSSIASILPSLGQMEYTVANLYLDDISYKAYPNIEHLITINLNQISDTGMAVDSIKEQDKISKTEIFENSIRSNEFPDILEKLLQSKITGNVSLSRYDLNSLYFDQRKGLNNLNDELNNKNTIEILEDSYTEIEGQIANIFAQILGVERISVHDDFFRIGGNSILAIQLSHQMSKVLGFEVRVSDVFKYKTPSQLLVHSLREPQIEIPKVEVKSSILSFSQDRLWFIEQYERGTYAYHIPIILE
ncbi:type I polyketide synthase, partial [uncultured Aquimarina sp.]|uniref:type I polyketide synthase n=1 Tax=uncultured Aquimarina sp. TaxID=575652 RepID=UPI00261FE728